MRCPGELVSYWNLPHFSFSSTDPALRDRQTYAAALRRAGQQPPPTTNVVNSPTVEVCVIHSAS